MSIPWRSTLVAMQTALQGAGTSLTIAESKSGYGLVSALVSAGETYDTTADDGASNASAFSAVLNLYVSQSSGPFLELDRVSRYIYGLYTGASFFLPQYAEDFGVITAAQAAAWNAWLAALAAGTTPPAGAAVPTLTSPLALPFDYTGGNFSTLDTRAQDAGALLDADPDALPGNDQLWATAVLAWTEGVWWDNASPPASHALTSPPTNPSPLAELASSSATSALKTAIANCEAWLSASTFT